MFKKNAKKCIAVIISAIMLCSSTAFAASTEKTAIATYNNIKIVVDGTRVIPRDVNGNIVDPFIIDGTTYLPVRALATALGKNVLWDSEANAVVISGQAEPTPSPDDIPASYRATVEVTTVYKDIKLIVDDYEVIPKDANGNIVEPFIIDGTTYLPVRALANALGENVAWDAATSTVYIGERPFFVDAASMKKFSDTTLITVGNTPVKGSFYNINIAQTCNSAMFPYYCDNYSSDKTLQTLTMEGIPVAKYFSDSLTSSMHPIIAVYEEAVKSNYLEKSDVISAIDETWSSYRSQFASDADYEEFLRANSISAADFEEYIKINTVYDYYMNDLYSRYIQVPYTLDELKVICNDNYVKVKHILVEDLETANKIINSIATGKKFDDLVSEYSLDSGQPIDGYTFTYGEMVPEFETASFNLAVNSYTKTPVKSSYGYHIIYRYPIDDIWIEGNASTLQMSLAEASLNEVVETLMVSSPVTITSDYDVYTSTIK